MYVRPGAQPSAECPPRAVVVGRSAILYDYFGVCLTELLPGSFVIFTGARPSAPRGNGGVLLRTVRYNTTEASTLNQENYVLKEHGLTLTISLLGV